MNSIKFRVITKIQKEMLEDINIGMLDCIRQDMDSGIKEDAIENHGISNIESIEFVKETIIDPDNMDEFYIGFSSKHVSIVREYKIHTS